MSLMSANSSAGGLLTRAERLTSRIAALSHYGPLMAKAAESPRLIAENRKARFDYFIEERFEAGLALQGWEVKSMRAGRAQLKEAYVYLRGGEAFLIGAHLVPLELYWKNGRAKLQLGLAKGKKQHDKRAVEKDRDWQRDKARLLRRG